MRIPLILSIVNLIPLQWVENPIIQVLLTIAVFLNILLNIILVLIKWYKDSKKDGKITSEEIEKLDEELKKILNEKE